MGKHHKHYKISDVAREAGVTPAIVSRVTSKDPTLRVRAETRERVLEAASRLAYVPNPAARSLRLATSGALGLIVHEVMDPLYTHILRGAQHAADAAGYVVLLGDADELARNEEMFKRLLGSGRIDGLIFQGWGFAEDASIEQIARARLPTVLMNSQSEAATGSVVLDDVNAGGVAARHLMDLGHHAIGFLGGLPGAHRERRRLEGVARALAEGGLPCPSQWVMEAGWEVVDGRDGMRALLSRCPRPGGIVVASVVAAIGALAAARDMDVAVPDELSIVAIHDTWFANHTSPPLTAVELPLYELGKGAVELLLDLLEGGPPRAIVITEPAPRLILRGSTASPGKLDQAVPAS